MRKAVFLCHFSKKGSIVSQYLFVYLWSNQYDKAMKSEKQQQTAAAAFAKKWEGKGYEKGESQTFWIELLTEIFGVEDPSTFIRFEQQAQLDHTSFIDGMIPSTHVLIEQKSLGKDLRQAIKQSDGSLLTPFQQAKIEQTAQAILDARKLYPDSSLAELYDPTLMPKELLQAHRQNDRAVMTAYGFSTKMTESECVAELFKRYAELVK